jgi:hypothetical protein
MEGHAGKAFVEETGHNHDPIVGAQVRRRMGFSSGNGSSLNLSKKFSHALSGPWYSGSAARSPQKISRKRARPSITGGVPTA